MIFGEDYFIRFYRCEHRDKIIHHRPSRTNTLTHKCQLSYSLSLADICTGSAGHLAGGELSLKATALIFVLPLPLIPCQFFTSLPPWFSHCADTHLLALRFSLILPTSNRLFDCTIQSLAWHPVVKRHLQRDRWIDGQRGRQCARPVNAEKDNGFDSHLCF